jgi:hypothetical protein
MTFIATIAATAGDATPEITHSLTFDLGDRF